MGRMFGEIELRSMSLGALWALYESTRATLKDRISEQRAAIDRQLDLLERGTDVGHVQTEAPPFVVPALVKQRMPRAPYPKVRPQFRNPDRPSETWCGRGNQPRWLVAQINHGKQIEDFRISSFNYPNERRSDDVRDHQLASLHR